MPSIIPAASIAPIMLVAHAMIVEKAAISGLTPASMRTSRAILLQARFGMTAPHTANSGFAPRRGSIMARTTGTERAIASSLASAPSTFAKGVLTPAANQISDRREWTPVIPRGEDSTLRGRPGP